MMVVGPSATSNRTAVVVRVPSALNPKRSSPRFGVEGRGAPKNG